MLGHGCLRACLLQSSALYVFYLLFGTYFQTYQALGGFAFHGEGCGRLQHSLVFCLITVALGRFANRKHGRASAELRQETWLTFQRVLVPSARATVAHTSILFFARAALSRQRGAVHSAASKVESTPKLICDGDACGLF